MSEYQVLARKYRPRKLSELIGQDVLVKTLSSAISQNRIPHAFILTGIRGIGKTSTARIIARSLLCTGADGTNEIPTAEPCGVCPNCQGIQNDNHVDVIEVDAASRTGVNDMREIIDQVNYSPVMGRLKLYIIDEVHMLSKSAFNALLKTLEEPPSHVKFIFATTEIRKIPITILSRCMRFDLPRVSAEKLVEHLKNVAAKENTTAEEDALKIIAGASEGSVRDSLSLLDQAIAVSTGENISTVKVREMLGLADKDQTYSLLENIFDAKFADAINSLNDMYDKGTDPVLILKDLLEITHLLTLAKTSESILKQNFISELEKEKSKTILSKTSLVQLTRMWQILNKGIEEARFCPTPLMAAEMVVIRACYASNLPTPSEILEKIGGAKDIKNSEPQSLPLTEKKTLEKPKTAIPTIAPAPIPAEKSPSYNQGSGGAPALKQIINENPIIRQENLALSVPKDFKELVALFISKRENFIASWLEEVKVIKYEPETGVLQLLSSGTPAHIDAKEITKKLSDWTGKRFIISLENTNNNAARSINDEKQEDLEKRKNAAINSSAVQSVLKEFSGSKITSVEEIF